MDGTADRDAPLPNGWLLLLRARWCVARNHCAQALVESPLKIALTVLVVCVIWLGLYGLFGAVFGYFQANLLQSVVAIPFVFHFFFLALLILLAFSNAIIVYGSLFGPHETAYLLSGPIAPRHIVGFKYSESLFIASWSLILLGIPLMLAMADTTNEPRTFYPLFLAFFLCFIPIPGATGLLAAWLTARYLPRSARRVLIGVTAALLVIAGLMFIRSVALVESGGQAWLATFLDRMGFIRTALLPSTWVTRGIDRAMHGAAAEALGYLAVTLANALFLSWIVVRIAARDFAQAYDRAAASRARPPRMAVMPGRGAADLLFAYLPQRLRLIAGKDLRTFLRDPVQWSQLAILFGLMGLYLVNMPRFAGQVVDRHWKLLVPFLNLGAVSFILATFTSRFVFPLVSLEGHHLWIIGLLPFPRRRLLLAKFAFAMTVTIAVAGGAMGLAVSVLQLSPPWAGIHLAVTLAVCVGLCGLAVGIGARLPLFTQTNPARIANGFGGTVNLAASVALVVGVLSGIAFISVRARRLGLSETPDTVTVLLTAGVVVAALAAGLGALWIGGRHLDRLEV